MAPMHAAAGQAFTRNTRRLETLKLQLRYSRRKRQISKRPSSSCAAQYPDTPTDMCGKTGTRVDAFKARRTRDAGKFCGACGIRDAEDWGGQEQTRQIIAGSLAGLSDEQKKAY